MAFLSFNGLRKSFPHSGQENRVLDGVTLDVREGEFVTLFGPNGCGKSTLLYILAGLQEADAGSAQIAGKKPGEAKAGFVFQNFHESLFPYKTILENVEFGPLAEGVEPREARETAGKWLEKVGLGQHAQKFPYELSGGMRQLAALARAWAFNPDVLIMDEPFSALDYSTRLNMEEELLKIWTANRKTTLFVSHDVDEAVFLADRVAVLSPRPCKVRKVINVPLARPRTREMRKRKEFFSLRNKVLDTFEVS